MALTILLVFWFSFGRENNALMGGIMVSMIVFAGMVSYILQCVAFIRLRRIHPDLPRPYRSPYGVFGAVVVIGISAITLGELEYGASKSVRAAAARAALGEFLLALEVAPFDTTAAHDYGRIRAALERGGRPIGPLDTLIAAHALALGVVLVSHNAREFGRVAGLRVDDWMN